MFSEPFYDPAKSYQDNFEHGPFGLFAGPATHSSVHPQAEEPKHRFLEHPVWAPFGVPAGPLLNGRFVIAALDHGFDIPVYKTVRTHRHACHPWPNVLAVDVKGDLGVDQTLVGSERYTQPLSITNSFGVPSYDPAFWQPDMAAAAAHAGVGQVVVGSYQATPSESGGAAEYIADFVLGARLVKETGVKVVEVNLSCPNEGTANLLCFDIARARQVVEAIKGEIGGTPLVIKIAYFRDDHRLEQFVREIGGSVDAISAINTITAEIVDANGKQALPGEGRRRSGVCGSGIQWAGLEMTGRLAALREEMGMKFAIVGVGGVGDAVAFDCYRRAGADAVMSATHAMWNPALACEIKRQAHEL
jgi:dihydroorotate dehydrogenase (NAD+) catalytic subunit